MLIPLKELIDKYGISPQTILHIGACSGEERNDYRDNGIKNVVWIEAIPEIFQMLKDNIQGYPGHSAINACIYDQDGVELTFHISDNIQSSSILELGTHAIVHPDVHYVRELKLMSSRADSLISPAPDMLNLDIQGAELFALKGMKWLCDVKYVYSEVNEQHLYKGCALIGEMDDYLDEFGFAGLAVKGQGDTEGGDAIWIRRDLICNSQIENH